MKKIITAALAAIISASLSCGAFAADGAASGDIREISEGRWLALAEKYRNAALAEEPEEKPGADALAAWWETLGDETLAKLIDMALASNRTLRAARLSVTEARAALGMEKASLLPWLDGGGSWTNARKPAETGGAGRGADLTRLALDSSWEIDIFGGRRQRVKAQTAELEAQYAQLHATWVTLSSETALNYISLRTLQNRLEIAKENLALQQDTYDLLLSKFEAGLSDALALNQAKYTLEQTHAAIPPIAAGIEQRMNVLAMLTGSVPGSLGEMLEGHKAMPRPDFISLVGIPADAIRRRPDIQAAERRLAAQTARKKAAGADVWPKFFLAGSIGTEALGSGSLFDGANKAYSLGPRLSWPIFHWGAIRNNIKVQTVRQKKALAAYEDTVLKAVAEVRDALAACSQQEARHAALARGVEAAGAALEVANDRYRNGIVDFNNVISAQRALLLLSDEYAVSEGERVANLIALYKALGGGWAPITAGYALSED